ncbi:hypothetical protein FOVG_18901 [Fusarium oxysporum f. sp. pisi HDV247]|uniref:Uncharacterized protein n=2 Tax=Fusarium oxysporum TaxID=5507 RepID=X0KSI4_FUSOX|nr:hypothetical protein FOVG_18901 [Fusarium oxysporum f. sp. pisi HDV247]EXM16528.1 hypothetical protein FOTG_15175 [Fusarium oxysporum f. sp. vasinfectum 25433]
MNSGLRISAFDANEFRCPQGQTFSHGAQYLEVRFPSARLT